MKIFSVVVIIFCVCPQLFAIEAKSFPRKQFKSFFSLLGQEEVNSEDNWSGAYWNAEKKTLWLCRNKWGVRAYKYKKKDEAFEKYKKFHMKPEKDHDFEAIAQIDDQKEIFLLINEKKHSLQEYDFTSSEPKLLAEWNLNKVTKKDESFEGLIFVPNDLLAKNGFVDGNGKPFHFARKGKDGIALIADQDTGNIFALDLGSNGNYEVVGRYSIPVDSTRGLEIDRKTGTLFAIDAERFAIFKLESGAFVDDKYGKGRPFKMIALYDGPGPKGAEGLAVATDLVPGNYSLFITDDDNESKNAAVRWYNLPKDLLAF